MCASSSPTSTPPGMSFAPPDPTIAMASSRAAPRTIPPRTFPRKGRPSCSGSTSTIGYRYFARRIHQTAPHREAPRLWRPPLPVRRSSLRFRPPTCRTGGGPLTTRPRALRKKASTTRGTRATASACRRRWVGWLRRDARGPPSCTCTCRGPRRRPRAPGPTRRARACTSPPSPSRRPPPSPPQQVASSAAPSTAWGTSRCVATPTRSVGATNKHCPCVLCLTKTSRNNAQIL